MIPGGLPQPHRAGDDPRVLDEECRDLLGLDSDAPDLDLPIESAGNIERAVRSVHAPIPGSQAFALAAPTDL